MDLLNWNFASALVSSCMLLQLIDPMPHSSAAANIIMQRHGPHSFVSGPLLQFAPSP